MKRDHRMTPRRWIRWLLLALLAYVVFLAGLLPARVAWEQVRTRGALYGAVTAHGLSGTLWSGAARQFTAPNGVALTDITWRLEPGALLTGQLRWGLRGAVLGGRVEGRMAVRPRGVSVSGVRADLPARTASAPFLSWPVAVEGRVVLDLARISIDRQGHVRAARGALGWLDAAAGMAEALPLGDLRADLQETDGGGLRMVVADQGGPLSVRGTITLAPSGAYEIQGEVGARSGADDRLVQELGMLGRVGPDGRVLVRLAGTL